MLIIVSVLAIVVKPLLNFPVVDFSTDQLSFLQSPPQYTDTLKTKNDDLSETSLANLLRKQELASVVTANTDEAPKNAPTDVSHDVPQNFRAIQQEAPGTFANETVQQADLPVVSSISKAATIQTMQPELLSNSNAELDANDIAIQTTLAAIDVEDKPTDKTAVKLDSEISRAHPALENPYSSQVKSLFDEPDSNLSLAIDNSNFNLADNEISALAPKVENTIVVINRESRFTSAHAIASPDPRYPSAAKRKGIELDVKINFIIDEQGRVKNIEFEKKNKVVYFRSAIRNAMAKWHFQPAMQNGRPIESTMSKIFSFSLTN